MYLEDAAQMRDHLGTQPCRFEDDDVRPESGYLAGRMRTPWVTSGYVRTPGEFACASIGVPI